MINTREVLIEVCKALGLVAVFITLIFSQEIYKALTEAPKPKLGQSTAFGLNKTNQKQK